MSGEAKSSFSLEALNGRQRQATPEVRSHDFVEQPLLSHDFPASLPTSSSPTSLVRRRPRQSARKSNTLHCIFDTDKPHRSPTQGMYDLTASRRLTPTPRQALLALAQTPSLLQICGRLGSSHCSFALVTPAVQSDALPAPLRRVRLSLLAVLQTTRDPRTPSLLAVLQTTRVSEPSISPKDLERPSDYSPA